MTQPVRRFRSRFASWTVLPLVLVAQAAIGAPSLTLTPLKPSGIYAVGETVGWTATLAAEAGPGAGANVGVTTGEYTYAIRKNDAEVIASGRFDPTTGPATIEVTVAEPAMLFLEASPLSGDNTRSVAGAATAPRGLQPSAPRPADFDAFWENRIERLHQIAPEPVLTPGDSGREGVEYATIRMKNIQGANVYGQLAKPAREGKFPAILILQWAGGPYPLQKNWVTDRAAEGWLALNIEPHDVPGDLPAEFYAALPAMIKSYNTLYHDDRDRSYFLRMYLGAYRAAEYLTGRDDWDGKILLAMGTSMGGQQSLAVAGLHPQITHVIVHVPAGADANAVLHGRSAGYPNWDATNPRVMETARYFDTVNFAARIQARCLISMGFVDQVCPPAGIWTMFNQINAPKEVVPLVDAPHNHQATDEQQRAYHERANAWLAALVKGAEPPFAP